MKKFIELTEAKGMVVFTFGRFNPPTTGHEKLIQKVASVAGTNPYRIYPSQSQNQKKDPLPFALKVAYMRKMFPKYAKGIKADKNSKTAIDIAVKLYDEGYTDLVMIVGSDRVKEFSSLLTTYNGVEGKRHGFYKFNSIDVVSAGERDPDAEDVSGMSASKMRAAASLGDFKSFAKGLPSGFRDSKKLYLDVRKYMGIREQKDMGEMTDFETLRDLYLTGKIWNIDDLVEANGVEGRIIRRGTNYVAFNDSDGKVHKAWLHDINEKKYAVDFAKVYRPKGVVNIGDGEHRIIDIEAKDEDDAVKKAMKIGKFRKNNVLDVSLDEETLDERNYASEYKNYHSRPEQIARRSSRNKARRVMGINAIKGMDVGHKDNDPMNNDPDNLRNEDPSDNRREPRLRDEKYDSDKFFSGKGTPEQRLQLLKLQNKALRVPGGSPKQNAIKKEIDALRKKMGMKVAKEEVELNELPDYSPAFIKKLLGKIDQVTHPRLYDKIVKDYVNAIKTRSYLDEPVTTKGKLIIDIIRQFTARSQPRVQSVVDYINKLVAKGVLPKELKAEFEIDERRTKQDPDIKDREGTQPAKYYAKDTEGDAMAPSTKKKRAAHFAKKKKGPAPGDASATTKQSTHTKKFKQMYGETKKQDIEYVKDIARAMRDKGHENLKKYADEFEKDALKSLNPRKELEKIPNIKTKQVANLLNMGEDFTHYPAQVDSKQDKSKGDWIKGDPTKPIVFTGDIQKDIEDANKEVERERGVKQKPMVESYQLDEKIKALVNKAKKSGMPYGILKKVYDRGMAAYKTGHRPGATPQQWALARVNSFTTKSAGTWGKADKDLADKVRGSKKEELETESLWKNIQKKKERIKRGSGERMRKKGEKGAPTSAQMKRAQEQVQEWFESEYTRNKYKENYGNDWWWKLDEVHDLMLDKLGVECECAECGCVDCNCNEKQNTNESEVREKAEYDGRPVKLNNPTRGDVKKYKVYVRNDKGNVVKVEYGDPNMEIKRDDPERRKSFRARHNCDNPGPKYKARYWSCKFWSAKSVTDLMKG